MQMSSRMVAFALLVLSLCGTQAMAATIFAKLEDGEFKYYTNSACTVESQLATPPETGIAGCKVLFGSDEEYQALVPYTNELATAMGGVPYLQGHVTLTADADWSAMDFNMNNKTVTLKGWDLTVRKPQGPGRFTSGNLIDPAAFTTTDYSYKDGSWYVLMGKEADGNYPGTQRLYQSFTVPKSRNLYLKFKTRSWNNSGYNQYVGAGIDAATNIVSSFRSGTKTTDLTYIRTAGPYTKSGLAAGSSHELEFTNFTGWTYVGNICLCPLSWLIFDIPEGEEYVNSNITLGGTSDDDFSGVGLQVRKRGKGLLTMSKENTRFGEEGVVSVVVDEGVVSKTDSTSGTCGAQYARIHVKNGAQFDICGRNYWDYDYTLAGSGPDGKGALVKSNLESQDPQRAYTKAENGFLRNITLSGDTLLSADVKSKACDWALMFYNYQANTMSMNGHTLTIDSPAYTGDCGGRIYAGNMSYKGEGKIVIATNGCFQTYDATYKPAASNCEMHVYGMLWAQAKNDTANMSVISPVKSLIFHESGLYRNLRPVAPVSTMVVFERYAPNVRTWSKNTTRLYPVVQLGDADHLETTFDLSRWTTTFDDSEEGTLTFYPGTTVTVDIGDRTSGFGGYAYRWKTKPDNVKFTRTAKMIKRGVHVVLDDYGFRFKTGFTIHVR